jgi:hypothetical protein
MLKYVQPTIYFLYPKHAGAKQIICWFYCQAIHKIVGILAFATRDIDKSHTGYKPLLSTYIQRKTL